MRRIARGFFDLFLALIFVPLIWFGLVWAFGDVSFAGEDQPTRMWWLLVASFFLAIFPVDGISKRIFAPRLRIHASAPPPPVTIVVMRGGRGEQQSSRLVTVRQDRKGRYVVPVDDWEDRS